ncbi:MAG: hypothetical protein A3E87_00220 [Gammaproteobacteria bacterium RIFCSPHIGHO2_12_FULL_35_23]|nr:MAG: hypothetical protein A3E87_00220 [Gammaproteobacteria bacterium RIFCSPHIGHO2_12_FULL_35_23]
MKKSNKILYASLGAAAIAGTLLGICTQGFCYTSNQCNGNFSLFSSTKKIIGDNNIITQTEILSSYQAVNVDGNFNVVINQGKQNRLSVTTSENILPYIKMQVTNNTLTISPKPGASLSTATPITVVAMATKLNRIDIGGNTNLHVAGLQTNNLSVNAGGNSTGDLQGDIKNLSLNLGGNSTLQVKVNTANSIHLTTAGSGNITLTGKTVNFKLETAGQTGVDAKNLIAQNVKITGAGSSVITVSALKNLIINIAGISTIKYYGSPALNKTVFGTATIINVSQTVPNQ